MSTGYPRPPPVCGTQDPCEHRPQQRCAVASYKQGEGSGQRARRERKGRRVTPEGPGTGKGSRRRQPARDSRTSDALCRPSLTTVNLASGRASSFVLAQWDFVSHQLQAVPRTSLPRLISQTSGHPSHSQSPQGEHTPPPAASLLVFRNPLCHTPSSLSSPRHECTQTPCLVRDCSHLEWINGFFSWHLHIDTCSSRHPESSPGNPLGLARCLLGWL